MITADARNRDVVHPFFIGAELLTCGTPQRWVVDFQQRALFEARSYPLPFEHIRAHVLPHISALAEKELAKSGKKTGQDQTWLQTWWQHFRCRKELVDSISQLSRYIVCSDTTKRPVFEFVSPDIRPDHKLRVFAFEDDYSFGVLQSHFHWIWFITKCSELLGRFNYTSSTVFDTFPWPQTPTKAQIAEVDAAAVALRALRREIMAQLGYSLRALYRTLEDPGANPLREAHTRLDTAVRAAYAMPKAADPLAFLLALNLSLAEREKAGEKITPPGLPLPEGNRAAFITEDCIAATATASSTAATR